MWISRSDSSPRCPGHAYLAVATGPRHFLQNLGLSGALSRRAALVCSRPFCFPPHSAALPRLGVHFSPLRGVYRGPEPHAAVFLSCLSALFSLHFCFLFFLSRLLSPGRARSLRPARPVTRSHGCPNELGEILVEIGGPGMCRDELSLVSRNWPLGWSARSGRITRAHYSGLLGANGRRRGRCFWTGMMRRLCVCVCVFVCCGGGWGWTITVAFSVVWPG